MLRNGTTSSGKQRWRCKDCRFSTVAQYDTLLRDFSLFRDYLFGKLCYKDMPGQGRQFRRNSEKFWDIWPMPPVTDRTAQAVFCDGIWIAKNVVLLIVVANTHEVLGWSAAPSERASDWMRLLSRIHPPLLCVCDGGTGFIAAAKEMWKDARIQRCQVHILRNINSYIPKKARDKAAYELYELTALLRGITEHQEAIAWEMRFRAWSKKWKSYLEEHTLDSQRNVCYRHKGLRRARSLIESVIKNKTLFAYIDFADEIENYSALAINNYIEGAVNSQLRQMLRIHRGMTLEHRLKACYWWLYEHTEDPLPIRRLLEVMPTNEDLEAMMHPKRNQTVIGSPDEWGSGLVWDELRHGLPYRGYIG